MIVTIVELLFIIHRFSQFTLNNSNFKLIFVGGNFSRYYQNKMILLLIIMGSVLTGWLYDSISLHAFSLSFFVTLCQCVCSLLCCTLFWFNGVGGLWFTVICDQWCCLTVSLQPDNDLSKYVDFWPTQHTKTFGKFISASAHKHSILFIWWNFHILNDYGWAHGKWHTKWHYVLLSLYALLNVSKNQFWVKRMSVCACVCACNCLICICVKEKEIYLN